MTAEQRVAASELPRETLTKQLVESGDSLSVAEIPDGAEPTTCESAFEEEMEAARKITRRYRNALRPLAKQPGGR